MRVLLIDIDSKIPNLALAKIEMYHKLIGDEIIYNNDLYAPIVDKIYVSTIFTFNKKKAENYLLYGADIGGTGWDISKKLPDEIENLKPKINLGFTTRGCIRNCHFCFVPQKEGKLKVTGDLYDLWDGISRKVTILDNNITAYKDHFIKILKQGQVNKLELDFNQGIDFRLLDEDMIIEMKKTNLTEIRMSLDHVGYVKLFEEKIKLLRKYYKHNRFFVYVFAGEGTGEDYDSCIKRLELLKKYKVKPYLMRHENVKNRPEFIKLAMWCNMSMYFFSCDIDDFKLMGSDKIKKLNERKLTLKLDL